jgi:hypothetical protein
MQILVYYGDWVNPETLCYSEFVCSSRVSRLSAYCWYPLFGRSRITSSVHVASWLRFPCSFSVPPGNCWDSNLNSYDSFLPHPSQFIIHRRFIVTIYVTYKEFSNDDDDYYYYLLIVLLILHTKIKDWIIQFPYYSACQQLQPITGKNLKYIINTTKIQIKYMEKKK